GAVIDLALVKNRLMFAGFDYSTGDILYGLLGKYKTLIYVPLAIIAALSAAVIPSLVKSVVLKDRNNLFKKIRFALKTSLSISIPSCVGLALLSRPIYLILFSTEYSSGYTLMLYGSSLVVFMSIVQIQTTILQG
ncbi:Polysaccharide biosynthesis family protein, partial [Candidatus Arthromitus sp. SFB-1]